MSCGANPHGGDSHHPDGESLSINQPYVGENAIFFIVHSQELKKIIQLTQKKADQQALQEEVQRSSGQNDEKVQRIQRYQSNIPKLYVMRALMSLHFFGAVLIPFFQDWGQLTFSQIMILESIFMGGIFIFEIPTGTIADKFGRKKSLIWAFVINVIAILIYSSAPLFWVFALGELVWGIAAALFSGAYEAMVYDTLLEMNQERKSKQIFSRLASIGLVVMISGSISGSFIAKYIGLRETMLFSAIPLIFAFGLALFLHEPLDIQTKSRDNPWDIFKKGLQQIRTKRPLRHLMMDAIPLAVIGYFGIWLYQVRLMTIGVSMEYFGLIHSGFILFEILLLNTAIPLERVFKSKKAIIQLTSAMMGIGFILAGIARHPVLVIFGFTLATGTGFARPVLMSNYQQKHIDSEQRATVISSRSMIRQFLLVILNPVVGFVAESNLTWVLIVLGLLALMMSRFTPVKEHYLID